MAGEQNEADVLEGKLLSGHRARARERTYRIKAGAEDFTKYTHDLVHAVRSRD
jgi:hypothetical protein